MLAVALPAATITLSDLTDGFPTITTSPDISVTSTAFSFEQVIITGLLPNVTIAPGMRSVILTEPGSDPFGPPQSDFVTLTIVAGAPFTLLFESDGATNYLANVAALPPTTPTLPENGAAQDVSSLLGLASGTLTITVQSDLATLEPEPDVRFLFASGLLLIGAALVRLKRPSSS
jgi:hypothetical protein